MSAADFKTARDTIVERVRKLRRRAERRTGESDHEADSARAEADRLMAKHNIEPGEVDDTIVEAIDSRAATDEVLRFVAALAATLAGAGLVANQKGEIGFRGPPAKCRHARDLYERITRDGEEVEMPPIAPWFEDQARIIWRVGYWTSFKARIGERLPGWGVKTPEQAAESEERAWQAAADAAEQEPTGLVGKFFTSVRALGPHIDLRWLEREAAAAGRRAADRVPIGGSMLALDA